MHLDTMEGKTVVITGATSGIGLVAAETLAKIGARIVFIARDKARGHATLDRLHRARRGLSHSIHFADLTRLSEMNQVAAQIAEQERRIDVLITTPVQCSRLVA